MRNQIKKTDRAPEPSVMVKLSVQISESISQKLGVAAVTRRLSKSDLAAEILGRALAGVVAYETGSSPLLPPVPEKRPRPPKRGKAAPVVTAPDLTEQGSG